MGMGGIRASKIVSEVIFEPSRLVGTLVEDSVSEVIFEAERLGRRKVESVPEVKSVLVSYRASLWDRL